MKSRTCSRFALQMLQTALLLLTLTHGTTWAQPERLRVQAYQYFDTVFDRFGKKYTPDELKVAAHAVPHGFIGAPLAGTSLYTLCTPGYFRIYLEDSCGMDHYATDPVEAARLNVLCRVLTDISNFIQSPCSTTGQTVNIWVRAGLTTGLGVATPFFNVPYSTTKSGIVDNTEWLTINSGADPFTGIGMPIGTSGGGSTGAGGPGSTYFHGSIAFNFTPSISWHTDLSTAPTSGEADLYTVALHEMMHTLGFCSLLKYDGTSIFGLGWNYFSRYDTHLENNSATDNLIKTTSGCDMYQFAFNTAGGFSPPPTILSPGGCGSYYGGAETNYTNCATAIKYVGGWSAPVPVYTPVCFEPGGSLSHFEDECYVPSYFVLGATAGTATNDQYFVMSNSAPDLALGGYNATTNPGVMKRYLTPEERQVLCDIGYKVNTTFGVPGTAGTYPLPSGPNLNYYDYGGSVCPGRQVVGYNDGLTGGTYTFFTTAPTPIVISGGAAGSILSNDRVDGVPLTAAAGGSFTCLEVMTGSGSVSVSSGTYSTVVTYTPATTDFGVQLLRYIPVSPTGVEGNITYIYVFVGDASCIPTSCNMAVNGDFENSTPGVNGLFYAGQHCWVPVNYDGFNLSPDVSAVYGTEFTITNHYYFQNGIVHPGSLPTNHHYVNMYNGLNTTGEWASSSIHERMTTPMISGQQYVISFWALRGAGITEGCCFTNGPTMLQFLVGNTFPVAGTPWVSAGYTPAGFSSLAEIYVDKGSTPDYNWYFYSDTVTYTGPDGGVLFVQPAPWDNTGAGAYVTPEARCLGLDDLTIVPLGDGCPFTIPGSISACDSPFSLDTAASVCVPGGTFSWPTTPVTGGGPTTTTSPLFNPAAAYAASLATGGGGLVPVTYTYTVSGCARSATTTIMVTPAISTIPAITGSTVLCAGDSTLLSDALAGGAWWPSNFSLASVDPSSGMVYAYGGGVDTINYTVGCGTTFIAVSINPVPGSIVGVATVCPGATTSLFDFTPGGTWSSATTSVATVAGGLVYGVSVGTDTISYTLPGSCSPAVLVVTVAATVSAITGTMTVCEGATTALADATTGGTWSSATTTAATVSATGVVYGVAAGTAEISYSLGGSCGTTTTIVTVNPLPAAITGTATFCAGASASMTETVTGGTWSSSNTAVATVDASGTVYSVAGGTATISYSLVCGDATMDITVNPVPAPVSGTLSICSGTADTLVDTVSGGAWTSSNSAIATVSSASGIVTPLTTGTVTISYSLASGCGTATAVITINPGPSLVSGFTVLCPGITDTLTDSVAGGTWTSSDVFVATVSPATGVVTAVATGAVTITYTLVDACFATIALSVDLVAGSVTGINHTTVGGTTSLTDIIPGGTWSSSNTGVATVGSTGVVTGAATGTTIITYSLPSGCKDTMLVTVTHSVVEVPSIGNAAGFTIIPNPNTGVFTISGAMTGETANIQVLDMLGKIIYTGMVPIDGGRVSSRVTMRDAIPNGIYTLRLVNDAQTLVMRLVIAR